MPRDETCNQVQLGKCLMSSLGNVYRLLIMYGAILIVIGFFIGSKIDILSGLVFVSKSFLICLFDSC